MDKLLAILVGVMFASIIGLVWAMAFTIIYKFVIVP